MYHFADVHSGIMNSAFKTEKTNYKRLWKKRLKHTDTAVVEMMISKPEYGVGNKYHLSSVRQSTY